jgi:hypothetical protein
MEIPGQFSVEIDTKRRLVWHKDTETAEPTTIRRGSKAPASRATCCCHGNAGGDEGEGADAAGARANTLRTKRLSLMRATPGRLSGTAAILRVLSFQLPLRPATAPPDCFMTVWFPVGDWDGLSRKDAG